MPSPAAPRWLLCVVCFASGALTLVIEIAGNRLLAPLFGNSVYTWTALIGVVLVAISVGGWVRKVVTTTSLAGLPSQARNTGPSEATRR